MMLPPVADAREITGRDVVIETPDGQAEAWFTHPAGGSHPGVLVWPDIRGLRPAFRAMADRLAQSGYAVVVVNPFYRGARMPVFPEGMGFRDPRFREIVTPLRAALTPEAVQRDAVAFTGWLDAQAAVDTGRPLGTTGYCMGGPLVMRTAAAVPSRVGAGASFHGGGLATSEPDSPHLLIPDMAADFLIAVAENDDEREPDARRILKQSFDAAGLNAEIEVYQDAMHGWCPPDSPVYHEAQAEKAWRRLLALFETALA